MISAPKTTWWKPLLFFALALPLCPGVSAQPATGHKSIDTLIIQLPSMMRSDEKVARQMIDELTQRSLRQKHRHGIIQSLFFKAWLSYRHDPADVAIASIDSALQHVEGIHSDTALVNFYILKGQCFVKKTQFGPALENFTRAIKIAEQRGDMATKTSTLISVGWAYMEDGKPAEAIRFFNEVLQSNPSASYPYRGVLLCNIAACYNTMGDFGRAESYAHQGIAAARESGSSADLANGLNILARSYYQQGKMDKAITSLKEAAVVREKVADPSMLASDYLELADLYRKNGQPWQTISWAKKAEAVSRQQANSLKLAAVYQSLSSAYEAVGDHKAAFDYLQKLLQHKDSLADDRYSQAFARMQVQFETQKKTAENLLLKQENLEARLRNSVQQRWLVLLAAGLVLLIASGIYISRLMKSRYNTRLAREQLRQQKKRIVAVMDAEEKERRRIAADLHDGVGQTLAAASLQLAKASKGQLPLDRVEGLISQASAEVRNLSHQVTPELLLHYGLVKAVEQAVDRLSEAGSETVFTLFTHIERPLEDEMASLTLYRCFQELCTNVLKHAHARQVTVSLNLLHDEVELIVEDDGVGFAPGEAMQGLGMKNMESRVALYDGELLVDSMPGKGTTVIVKINRPA